MLANAALSTMIKCEDEVAGRSHPKELRDAAPAVPTSLLTSKLFKTIRAKSQRLSPFRSYQ
ncbi:hypothetical protein BC363_00730 [Ensifer sp. LC384]|nr:hypothetical protein BC363_00730 [Ensifer sp. LC384]